MSKIIRPGSPNDALPPGAIPTKEIPNIDPTMARAREGCREALNNAAGFFFISIDPAGNEHMAVIMPTGLEMHICGRMQQQLNMMFHNMAVEASQQQGPGPDEG